MNDENAGGIIMRGNDIRIFREAAKKNNVYILVRQANKESLVFIGQPGYSPKRIDCKPTTAMSDAFTPYGQKMTAGLVVDPTLPGFNSAFTRDSLKFENAKKLRVDRNS